MLLMHRSIMWDCFIGGRIVLGNKTAMSKISLKTLISMVLSVSGNQTNDIRLSNTLYWIYIDHWFHDKCICRWENTYFVSNSVNIDFWPPIIWKTTPKGIFFADRMVKYTCMVNLKLVWLHLVQYCSWSVDFVLNNFFFVFLKISEKNETTKL
jgi:hypothetical protein